MPGNRPFVLYVRKSTEEDERQAQSLESQEDVGRQFAEKLGIEVVVVFDAHSAKEPGRPVFDDILKRIDRGEFGGMVAWHPDRLSRNELDAAAITYRLRKGVLPELHFVSYHFQNSNEGIMMLQFALSQSQYSSSKLSVDVRRGMEQKVRKGWFPYVAPLGYVNDKHLEQGERTVSTHPELFPLMRRAWDLLLTGAYTIPHIQSVMNEQWGVRVPLRRGGGGGGPVPLSTLYKVFQSIIYAGYFRYNGEIHEGKHQPMVSLEEFDRAQKIIGRHNPLKARTTRTQPYTGLIRCSRCGGKLTVTVKTKPSGRTYVYYHCQGHAECTKHGISERALEETIREQLADMELDDQFFEWAVADIKESGGTEIEQQESVLEQRSRALRDAEQALDALLEMRMRNLLTDDEYLQKKQKLVETRTRLSGEAADLQSADRAAVEANLKAAEYMRYAALWLRDGDVTTKRTVALNLASNYVWNGEKVLPELATILVNPKNAYVRLKAEYEHIELDKSLSKSEKQNRIEVIKTEWCRTWEINRTSVLNEKLSFGIPGGGYALAA